MIIASSLFTILVMTAFEVGKEILVPGLSKWESHLATIVFTTVVAVFLSYSIIQNRKFLIRKLSDEMASLVKAKNMISELLSEKEILLKEVHHRVKNNMATVSSILSLQASYTDNVEAQKVLYESRDRVHVMMKVYDKLYLSRGLSIGARTFFSELVAEIAASYGKGHLGVSLSANIDDLDLDSRTIVSLGMIANELVTNSFKYAFEADLEGQEISIRLSKASSTEGILSVSDNGKGMDTDVMTSKRYGFGLELVTLLSTQICGTLSIENQGGTRFSLRFPMGGAKGSP